MSNVINFNKASIIKNNLEIEKVGSQFDMLEFDRVRQQSWNLLYTLSDCIRPGMTEMDAHNLAKDLFKEFGCEKNWHPTKIRFGSNTLKSFRELSEENIVLQEDDIFFLDLGPVFSGYEGDVGETFVLGQDQEKHKIMQASKDVFQKVKEKWQKDRLTGQALYDFASNYALEIGYKLDIEGSGGHRISEFPHALYHKGKLKDFENVPTTQRWVLEIHLHHPSQPYGAFYEDILTIS